MAQVYPVIMCGGAGTRLWPMSRPSRPKQFVRLIGGYSLFQQTALRAAEIDGFHRLVIVTGHNQAHFVRRQLDEIGLDADILLEPKGRDSAPAIAAAALHLHELDQDSVAVILASDHHIPDSQAFLKYVAPAIEHAQSREKIVTLGIQPTSPSTAYGYIKPSALNAQVSDVVQFLEKPTAERAKQFIKDGYLWNSGNFISSASHLLKELEEEAPELLAGVKSSLDNAVRSASTIKLGAEFRSVDPVSFDIAVMEKTKNACVALVDFDWSDLGTWDSIHKALPQDQDGNAKLTNALFYRSKNCNGWSSTNQAIVGCHVEDINIVVEDDVVFVSSLDHAAEVKDVVSQLKSIGRPEHDFTAKSESLKSASRRLKAWLDNNALPLWLTAGFDHNLKIWRESLNADGTPTGEPCRARVQGRQNYVYANAKANGWNGPAESIVLQANSGIESIFTNEAGLLRNLVDADGNCLNEETLLYDQTFTLLSLAEQVSWSTLDNSVFSKPGLSEASSRFLVESEQEGAKFLDNVMAGFREAGTGFFFENDVIRHQSNPIMHLFEACLAWIEVSRANKTTDIVWVNLAMEIVQLLKSNLFNSNSGWIHEWYDENWKPLTETQYCEIIPGHQFEWAWLLIKWHRLQSDQEAVSIANILYNNGLGTIDPRNTVVVDQVSIDGRLTRRSARLWQQTEWLKASLVMYEEANDCDKILYADQIDTAIEAFERYFEGKIPGLWHDALMEDGHFESTVSPASSLYHISSAIMQMLHTSHNCTEL